VGRRWTLDHTYALVARALLTSWLIGCLIAAVSGFFPPLDLAGHLVFGVVLFVGLRKLHRRIDARQPVPAR
jgi:hypothetical protein